MSDCIISTGHKNIEGYPRVGDKLLHRLICAHQYKLRYSDKWITRHMCGNPSCINPEHLEPGTHQENMDDRTEHGRTQKGEAHYKTNLTEADILAIRAASGSQASIAKLYGIGQPQVSSIKRRKSWGHVNA